MSYDTPYLRTRYSFNAVRHPSNIILNQTQTETCTVGFENCVRLATF